MRKNYYCSRYCYLFFLVVILAGLFSVVPQHSFAQDDGKVLISGTVKDKLGTPLENISVTVAGHQTEGTTTSKDGKFSIRVLPKATLELSGVNYVTQSVPVNNNLNLDIQLEAKEGNLNEVVVVGFGRQRKISQIGAQGTIKADDLRQPVANLSTVLGGRVSGVIAVQRSGEPGRDNADVWIRGISTFGGNNSRPLVIIDGVPRGEGIIQGNTMEALRNINPEDIESFTILKDASATAVYGVRGANGVIIINTKSGRAGKATFDINYNQGVTTFTRLPKMADAVTYMTLANEARAARGEQPQYLQSVIDNTIANNDPYLYPNVKWFDEVFNKYGHNKKFTASIRGGGQAASFYVSGGYYDERGFLKVDPDASFDSDNKFTRYNFTSNLTVNATATTKLDLGIQGWISNGNYPGKSSDDILNQTMQLSPNAFPVAYPNNMVGGVSPNGDQRNPWAEITQTGYRNEVNNQLLSNLRISQQLDFLTQGLSIGGLFSFDAFNNHIIERIKDYNTWLATGRDSLGNLQLKRVYTASREFLTYSRLNRGSRQFYSEASLNYARDFGPHKVTGMVLYNQRDLVDIGLRVWLENLPDNITYSIPYRSRGLAGRATYSFSERYFGEFNFGYNGSENFHPDRRYGFFPSIGLGWVASNESFFENLKNAIQFLKIRGSYGLSGNGNIGGRRFAYTSEVNENTGGYSFGLERNNNSFSPGIDIAEYASNVSWEESRKANIGFEIKTLSNTLSLTVDYFKEWREGIFLRRQDAPLYMGLRSNPFGNLGSVTNEGFDGSLEFSKSFGDWRVGFLGTFTKTHDKVTQNGRAKPKYPWMQDRLGDKILARYGYIALGYFTDQHDVDNNPHHINDKPGDIRYKDLNEDGIINSEDRTVIGYGDVPEIFYGGTFNLTYKSLDISAFFQGMSKVDIITNGNGFIPFAQGFFGALYDKASDRWSEADPNPNAFYPRLSYGVINYNYEPSTWWVKDGSYTRLRLLELGYTLPKKWYDKYKISTMRIFFLGNNLLTFSKFKLWDVELGTTNGSRYPLVKTFSLGANIKF